MIDLPFEGSRKYRRRERVPKAGSRREEIITEPINSFIIVCFGLLVLQSLAGTQ